MGTRVLRWCVAAVLAGSLASSCGSAASPASEASSPQEPAQTTTPSASPSPTQEGCGDRAGILPPFTEKGTETVAGSSVTLTLSEEGPMHDFFSPSCVVATPGSTLTVVLRNTGTQRHNLTIMGQHIDKDVPVGKTVTVTVNVPSSKPLLFECKYHAAGGMKGAFLPEG